VAGVRARDDAALRGAGAGDPGPRDPRGPAPDLLEATSASGNFTRHPFWSADDEWLYFYEDDGHSNPGIRRVRSRGGRIREGVGIGRQGQNVDVERVYEIQTSASGSFVLGTDDMVFEIQMVHDFRYSWQDLFLWRGPNPGDLEQLTFGERTRDPHVSPDGRTVVYSRNDNAQSRLAFLDLHTRKVVEVAPPEDRLAQVFSPRWAPDSRRVAYSGWREGGYRDIYIYDRTTQTTERITADRFLDTEPTWTPDGAYVLFASDRDDVFNIYAYEVETGRLRQVTNVIGGAFEPVVSNDGQRLAYIGFSAQGYDLWTMKLDPAEFFAPLPVVDDLPAIDDPTPELEVDAGRSPTRRGRRYQAIRTMYPRSLLPTVMDLSSSLFGTEIGGTMAVSDVLGFHALTGSARYSTAFHAPAGSVNYRFAQLLPVFRVGFGRSYARRNSTYVRYDYENVTPGGGQGGYQVRGYDERITQVTRASTCRWSATRSTRPNASVDYTFTKYANVDAENFVDPNAPASSLPEVGGLGQVDLSFAYNNFRAVRHGYYSETGRAANVRMTVIDPHLGGRFKDLQVAASYTELLRMPWRGHQVLALRAAGGASAGGLGRRSPFFIGGQGQQNDVIRSLLMRDALPRVGRAARVPAGGVRRALLPGGQRGVPDPAGRRGARARDVAAVHAPHHGHPVRRPRRGVDQQLHAQGAALGRRRGAGPVVQARLRRHDRPVPAVRPRVRRAVRAEHVPRGGQPQLLTLRPGGTRTSGRGRGRRRRRSSRRPAGGCCAPAR
jgi:Tol biopolymer transport system component